MPNLRNKVNKRKSDSFVIDNDKAIKKQAIEKKLAAEKKIAIRKKIAAERKLVDEANKVSTGALPAQFKSLQEAFKSLAVENEENKKLVVLLKKQVSDLQDSQKLNRECKQSQTEMNISSIEKFTCQKCSFQGSSNHFLRKHLNSEHRELSETAKINYSCHKCGNQCENYGKLMAHMKKEHVSLTKVCSFFREGKCIFKEDNCWFKHEELETTQNSTIFYKHKEYNCRFCGKVFDSKKEFMIHRKKEHKESVSECFEYENGWCRFGDQNCWFKHQKKILNSKSENSESENGGIETSELFKRLFDIMEAFGERMCNVENLI